MTTFHQLRHPTGSHGAAHIGPEWLDNGVRPLPPAGSRCYMNRYGLHYRAATACPRNNWRCVDPASLLLRRATTKHFVEVGFLAG
eukprot:3792316-Amphidinium_carterae.1